MVKWPLLVQVIELDNKVICPQGVSQSYLTVTMKRMSFDGITHNNNTLTSQHTEEGTLSLSAEIVTCNSLQ